MLHSIMRGQQNDVLCITTQIQIDTPVYKENMYTKEKFYVEVTILPI